VHGYGRSAADTPDIFYRSFSTSLHNRNLLGRQPVQLVHQFIDRRIRRPNLPGQQRLLAISIAFVKCFRINCAFISNFSSAFSSALCLKNFVPVIFP
jgi:hypothetical protein